MTLRVLICEDSRTYADALRRMLEHDGDIIWCRGLRHGGGGDQRPAPHGAGPGDHGRRPARHARARGGRGDHELPAAAGPRAVRPRRPAARRRVRAGRRGAGRARQGRSRPAATRPARWATAFRHRVRVLSRARVIRHPRARLSGSRRRRGDPPGAPAGPPGRRDRHLRVGWRSPGADAPAQRAAGRLPDPDPGRAAHRAGFTDGLASWLDRSAALPVGVADAGHAAAARGLARPGGRAPHAHRLRAAGHGPARGRRPAVPWPVAGYELSLRDENGSEATDGEIGDLWCSGPSIGAGYWNKREVSSATFVGGWLKTGDKYLRDTDGYYHFAGRSDDMLKVGGIWVSPFEVESTLLEHPQVREAAVIGAARRGVVGEAESVRGVEASVGGECGPGGGIEGLR